MTIPLTASNLQARQKMRTRFCILGFTVSVGFQICFMCSFQKSKQT